jgi:hypothetical protein
MLESQQDESPSMCFALGLMNRGATTPSHGPLNLIVFRMRGVQLFEVSDARDGSWRLRSRLRHRGNRCVAGLKLSF